MLTSEMGLFSRIPIVFVAILCFFNFSTKADFAKGLTQTHPSERSYSSYECNESEFFPKPPCCGISHQVSSNRIHGGSKVEPGELPWMVIIYSFNASVLRGFGGGSLINSRWVLTAGHNVEKVEFPADLEIHLGEMCRSHGSSVCAPHAEKFLVEKIIIHEQFGYPTPNAPNDDIALLRLANAVTFNDFISPICLPLNAPKQPNYADMMALVAGWGITESGGPSDVLLKTSLKVWDSVNCQKFAGNVSIDICAGGVKGIASCTGDSGGPLMSQVEKDGQKPYYQIGLVSYGKACGQSGIPSVYTNVAAYIQWINATILKNQ